MFGWFKRKAKTAAIPQSVKSEKPPPSYKEVMAAKRRRTKARRNRPK